MVGPKVIPDPDPPIPPDQAKQGLRETASKQIERGKKLSRPKLPLDCLASNLPAVLPYAG